MKRFAYLLAVPLIFSGCASIPVKRDYDTSVNFQTLKNYAWQPMSNGGMDPEDNSLMEDRVQKAVDADLAAKGYQKATAGAADFMVSSQYTVERETDAGNVHSGIGLGGGSGGVFGGFSVGLGSGPRDYDYEILTVAVLSPKTGKVMWQGSTREPLTTSSDPKKTTKRINATVNSILAKFPPK